MTSIGQENLETVMIDLFGALRRGHFDAVAGLLDPEIAWQGLREEWVCRGREEVLETFRSGLEQRREIDALEFTRGSDQVVLGARGSSITEVAGEPLGGQIFNVFTLHDGRIVRIDDHRGPERSACGSRRRRGCGLALISDSQRGSPLRRSTRYSRARVKRESQVRRSLASLRLRTVDSMSSHFAMWPSLNWQSTMKTVDSGARSARGFSPRSTTTLSEPKSCDSWSQPVRLQTIIGRPVSSVRASHSPFGPHAPGHQAADETSSCAPESRRRSAGTAL
jgi:hypothetical protein